MKTYNFMDLENVGIEAIVKELCQGETLQLSQIVLEELIENMDEINTLMIQKSGYNYIVKVDDVTVRRYIKMNKEWKDYYSRHLDIFIEGFLGVKLSLYQRILIRLFNKNKRNHDKNLPSREIEQI